ncbi:hypothetical protein ACE1CI_17585 [Aerosakkonemataceae cyanobacterium BLCC-F50]|uniref:Uncharacterized protein n=1 Tax=Floridaenema flaviceps BLCC-F50 TaxID=3153642 RepID=A0ABV4XUW8_9CYAN
MTQTLIIQPLTTDFLPAVVELDQKCFAGLWTLEGYQRELDSPNSDVLLILTRGRWGDGGMGGWGDGEMGSDRELETLPTSPPPYLPT